MTDRSPSDHGATPLDGAWRSSVSTGSGLPEGFLARPAEEVAPALLGCVLRSTRDGHETAGIVVETEAYTGPGDPACHAARRTGRTERNRSMFAPPGTAYVYFVYGMHWCFNVVTSREGDPQAVLIRGLEPLEGVGTMQSRRGEGRSLTSGPACLCQALAIDGTLDGHDLSRPPLILEPRPESWSRGRAGYVVGVSGRIGIRQARDWPLRFFLKGNPHVSSGPHVRLPQG